LRVGEQFNALIWGWAETFRALGRRVGLGPFLVYAAVQTLVVVAIGWFAAPGFRWAMVPLLGWRFGDAALHYPTNFLALRSGLAQADIVLSIVLGALVSGAAVHMLASFWSGSESEAGEGWREAGRRYLPLLVVAAVTLLVSQFLTRFPMAQWGYLADARPLRFRMLRMAVVAAVMAAQALLVYAPASVMLRGDGPFRAVGRSVRLALRAPITTYLIVAVPTAVELAPAWLSRQSALIAERFSPELLVAVMVVWIIALMFIGYVTLGSSTRLLLHMSRDERDDEGRAA
jgi:hypothetical protein